MIPLVLKTGFSTLLLAALVVAPGQASPFKLTLGANRMTLEAVNVPLRSILTQMAAQGIAVQIGAGIDPPVTANFANESLASGLDRILGDLNHVVIWGQVDGPAGVIPRVAEIQIFETGKHQAMAPLPHPTAFDLAQDPASGAPYVRKELLLGLEAGMDRARFQRLLDELDATVVASHSGTGIYRIRIGGDNDLPALARRLNALEGVARAEPNWAHRLPLPRATRGAYPQAAQDPISAIAGEYGVPIAVLDSGLDAGANLRNLTLAALDALDPQTPISDPLGHGTQMALIASGVVTPYSALPSEQQAGNPIIAVRAFDDTGVTSNFALLESIDFAIANGARVMSLSWGTETASPFLEHSMNYARSQGLIIVAAAGNEPTGRPYYPAAYPSVIGVGALDGQGRRWEKSNYGEFVTLSAPGIAAFPVSHPDDPQVYAGTSIATAYVARRIATELGKDPARNLEAILADLAASP